MARDGSSGRCGQRWLNKAGGVYLADSHASLRGGRCRARVSNG